MKPFLGRIGFRDGGMRMHLPSNLIFSLGGRFLLYVRFFMALIGDYNYVASLGSVRTLFIRNMSRDNQARGLCCRCAR